MTEQPRILILEGYDEHPFSGHGRRASTREVKAALHRAWCATKRDRKVTVVKFEPADADDQCSGEVVYARTKRAAKSQAVRLFRNAPKNYGRVTSLSGAPSRSRGMNTAQRRFAAAAKACRVAVGTGGKNRSYLSCMQKKLKR